MSTCSSVFNYTPATTGLFKTLYYHYNKDYFDITQNDSELQIVAKKIANVGKKALIVIAMTLSVLVLPILMPLEYAVCRIVKSMRKDDCHFFYTTSVFQEYTTQLIQFTQSYLQEFTEEAQNDFEKQTLDFAQKITQFTVASESENRRFHQDMLTKLRSLIVKKENRINDPSALTLKMQNFINALSVWQFTQVNLTGSMQNFITSDAILNISETSDLRVVPQILEKAYQTICNDNRFLSIFYCFGNLYDAHLLGDLPTKLDSFTITTQSERSVQVIRTPSVTKDLERQFLTQNLLKAKVNEEFSNFIRVYANNGKKHLYVNVMKRSGSEAVRSHAIEAMEEDATLKDGIRVVTLNTNSEFYQQHGSYETQDNAIVFKNTFLEKMFEVDGDYYWPKELDKEILKAQCKSIIDNVHRSLFNQNDTLTQDQRKNFIELTYIELIPTLAKMLDAHTLNVTCKSCIDRGASILCLLYLKQMIERKEKVDIKKALTIAYAPAILSMNRPMTKVRFSRLHSAINHYISYIPSL